MRMWLFFRRLSNKLETRMQNQNEKTLEEMSKVYTPSPAVPEPGWQEVGNIFAQNVELNMQ